MKVHDTIRHDIYYHDFVKRTEKTWGNFIHEMVISKDGKPSNKPGAGISINASNPGQTV
jgi:hypothetical protein